jgi:hypothetical protein
MPTFDTVHTTRDPRGRFRGRPSILGLTAMVSARLPADDVRTLRRLGGGNMSAGIRELLRRYADDRPPSAA